MTKLLLIGGFGLLGVLSRYFLGLAVTRSVTSPFPYATLSINLMGAFVIGIVYVLGSENSLIPEDLRIGIMVGYLGGFTTFSSYCLETMRLLETGQFAGAALYAGLSNFLGVVAAWGGMALTRLFFV